MLELRAADEMRRAEALAADADARRKEAVEIREGGDAAAAEAMMKRAGDLDGLAIRHQTSSASSKVEATDMQRDATAGVAAAVRADEKAQALRAEADAQLIAITTDVARADDLRTRAERMDGHARTIEEQIRSGVAAEILISDDIEGIELRVNVPGRAPTPADLPGASADDVDVLTGAVFEAPAPAPSLALAAVATTGVATSPIADDLDVPPADELVVPVDVSSVTAATFDEPMPSFDEPTPTFDDDLVEVTIPESVAADSSDELEGFDLPT